MNALQRWNRCPDCIEIGENDSPIRLLKRNNQYGVRSADTGRLPAGVQVEPIGDDVAIAHAPPSPELGDDLDLLPVYAADERASPAVATRRVFLRLDENTPARALEAELEALGFVVTEVPRYAPHSAWLEPASGRVDEALSMLERLRALPHAASAEPQLLRPKSKRSPSRGAPPAGVDGEN
ncbi:MAG: hypothetical protein R3286_18760 [Gammaproteobacteria bacterium]|nr:hypothetical protein [Gammaproteobacteria bacterium]